MNRLEAKQRSLDELSEERLQWRDQGLELVLANGAFDLIHVGHLRYLEGARASGDLLLVAVNSDHSVRLSKGSRRPILPEAERLEMVAALACVDRILLFDDKTVEGILQRLEPEVHAKGTDYTSDTVPERVITESYGGRTEITGDPKDHATTDVIAKILELFAT